MYNDDDDYYYYYDNNDISSSGPVRVSRTTDRLTQGITVLVPSVLTTFIITIYISFTLLKPFFAQSKWLPNSAQ
jgi:hypothetical protein